MALDTTSVDYDGRRPSKAAQNGEYGEEHEDPGFLASHSLYDQDRKTHNRATNQKPQRSPAPENTRSFLRVRVRNTRLDSNQAQNNEYDGATPPGNRIHPRSSPSVSPRWKPGNTWAMFF